MDIENKAIAPISEATVHFYNYDPVLDLSSYQYPTLELLENYDDSITIDNGTLEINKNKIVETFNYSQIEIDAIRAIVGPSLTLYEFIPAPGARISKIKNLKDDLALILAAEINIIGPIPGKGTMGIEVPHKNPALVSIRSVLATQEFQMCDFDLPIALGKTMSNEVFLIDLTKLPHLLIAGATGQGKSVCLNAMLFSLLYKKHPSQLKLVLIDTNNLELGLFRKIERHFLAKLPGETEAVVSDKLKAINTLNALAIELDQRYDLLKYAGVRQIKEYNEKFIASKLNLTDNHRYLPFIVVMIDEFAELLTDNKEIDLVISRLAQMGRAAGIHLIISTQRPSIKIITGTIKANFTCRIAFRVTSAIDSRTILDSSGADLLNGHGDMLLSTGYEIIHLQGAYVETTEVERVGEFIGSQPGYSVAYQLPEYRLDILPIDFDFDFDSMFEDAARLIVMYQQGPTSLIQRKLRLGYNRTGRIIDQLEAAGVIGPFEGGKARKVNIPTDYALEIFLKNLRLGKPSSIIPKKVIVEPVNVVLVQTEEKIIKAKLTDPIAIPLYPVQHEQKLIKTDTTAVNLIPIPIKHESKSNKKSFWDWLFK